MLNIREWIIMAYPDALIYQMQESGPTPVKYEETEHFQVTRDFLKRPDFFLDLLLADE